MSDFDQRTLAELWELENSEEMDRRAELAGERFISLFLQKLDGRSYVFEHGLGDEAADGVDVGDAEYEVFDTPQEAQTAYDLLLAAARRDGTLVDEDLLEGLGDVATDAPALSDLAEENSDNDNSVEETTQAVEERADWAEGSGTRPPP